MRGAVLAPASALLAAAVAALLWLGLRGSVEDRAPSEDAVPPPLSVAEAAESSPETPPATDVETAGEGGAAALAAPPEETRAPHQRATPDAPFENSLGMQFVPVPGTDVLFSVYETRRRDYAAYARERPGINEQWIDHTTEGYLPEERLDEHPVMRVSWSDAKEFAAWLSEREGLSYRLPTDREWSVAVGLGELENPGPEDTPATVARAEGVFPWGEEHPPPPGAGNFSDESRRRDAPREGTGYLVGYDDGFPITAPVGSFPANPLGLRDLEGNVSEWVLDDFGDDPEEKTARGGAFNFSGPRTLASTHRHRIGQNRRMSHVGFRLVLEREVPPPQGAPKVPEPDFENSLGMQFVELPGEGILFAIHETRWRDYAAFAAENPGLHSGWEDQERLGVVITERPEDHPVSRVSWHEANAFCRWLSEKEGRTYRLPTDHEWSAAVGLGEIEVRAPGAYPENIEWIERLFPWGSEYPPPPGSGNFSDMSLLDYAIEDGPPHLEGYHDGYPTSAPVMSYRPNALGIFDLAGNLTEWSQDWFDAEETLRNIRGSSWNLRGPTTLFSSHRRGLAPGERRTHVGFRVVIDPEAPPPPVAPSPQPPREARPQESADEAPAAPRSGSPTATAPADTGSEPVETESPPGIELSPESVALLESYLSARNERLLTLADSYRESLASRRDSAPAAYDAEIAHLDALRESLDGGELSRDFFAPRSAFRLEDLPEDSPAELRNLRGVWNGATDGHFEDLKARLKAGSQTLIPSLVRVRKLEEARTLRDFIDSL